MRTAQHEHILNVYALDVIQHSHTIAVYHTKHLQLGLGIFSFGPTSVAKTSHQYFASVCASNENMQLNMKIHRNFVVLVDFLSCTATTKGIHTWHDCYSVCGMSENSKVTTEHRKQMCLNLRFYFIRNNIVFYMLKPHG